MLIGLSQSGLTPGAGGTVNPTYTILWKNQGFIKEEVGRRNEFGETANVCYIYLGTRFPNDSSFQPGFHFVLYHQPNGLCGNFAIITSPMLSCLQ